MSFSYMPPLRIIFRFYINITMPINYILNLMSCQPNLRYLILCRLWRPFFRILRLNDIFVLVRLYYMSIWHSFVLFRVLFSFCCRVIDFSTKSQRNIFFATSSYSRRENSSIIPTLHAVFEKILTLPDKYQIRIFLNVI